MRQIDHQVRQIDQQYIEERARRQLTSDCPCAYYIQNIHVEYDRGVLKLWGKMPTHGLKSVVESLLSRLDGVEQIDNQVDVISSTGLSSVRAK